MVEIKIGLFVELPQSFGQTDNNSEGFVQRLLWSDTLIHFTILCS